MGAGRTVRKQPNPRLLLHTEDAWGVYEHGEVLVSADKPDGSALPVSLALEFDGSVTVVIAGDEA